VLGLDYGAGDRLAKLIPDPIMGRSPSFEDCMKAGEPLRKAYDEEPEARNIIDVHKIADLTAMRASRDFISQERPNHRRDKSGRRLIRSVQME